MVKSDGTRCWGWSSGAAEMQGLCRVHARRAGKVSAIGMSAAQITRARIASAAPGIVEELENLAYNAESEQVRFNAMKDLLDRGGYKAALEVAEKIDITISDSADIVRSRLDKLRKGQEEKQRHMAVIRLAEEGEIIDAEIVEEDTQTQEAD